MSSITVQDAVILHLNRYSNRRPNEFSMPFDTTQDGIAAALGITLGHVSLELKKLSKKGSIGSIIAHTPNSKRKRITYYLKPQGMSAVPAIAEIMRIERITEESIFIGYSFPDEVKRDPWKMKAMKEIEKAAAVLGSGQSSPAIIHLTLAIKELAAAGGDRS